VLWAHLVAVVHALAVVLMVTGALVAVRHPRLLWVHAPVAAAILAVNLAGAPCPLTDLELALRERAGAEPYTGGFLGHYALAPFGLDVAGPGVQAGIYTVAVVPNVLGYGLLALRARHAVGTAHGPGGRRAGEVVPAGVETALGAQPHRGGLRAGLSPGSAPAGSRRSGPRARTRRC
jgi:hypothetical protein